MNVDWIDYIIKFSAFVLAGVVLKYLTILNNKIKSLGDVEAVLRGFDAKITTWSEKFIMERVEYRAEIKEELRIFSAFMAKWNDVHEGVIRAEEQIKSIRENCELRHKWNGLNRRKS